MEYNEKLESNKEKITKQIEVIFNKYKVQTVGWDYIDCIVMKENAKDFVEEISALGILIHAKSWWCYVNPKESNRRGCPNGYGGPRSKFYEGWFSELPHNFYQINKGTLNQILQYYESQLIYSTNLNTFKEYKRIIDSPFRYMPNEYIPVNDCVTPAFWLYVPDDWRRIE